MTTIANTMTATNKGQRTFQSVAAFARMANATAYIAGDAMTDDASENVSSIIFPNCGAAGIINRVRLCVDEVDTMSFSLLLFDAEPTGFLDGTPIVLVDADIEKLIGRYDFANTSKLLVEIGGTWTSFRPTLDYDALGGVPFSAADGQNLYGLLMVTTGYTPASAAKVNIRLQGEADLL